MSKIGSRPIPIPEGVQIETQGEEIWAKGPKGEMKLKLPPWVVVEKQENCLVVKPTARHRQAKACWGTARSLVANLITGVTQGWRKKLQVVGTGYRASLQGEKLVLNVGYSHPVVISPPPGIVFKVDGEEITVEGVDKQLVGQVAAEIRQVRPPDPYKGKGIRYVDEEIKLKPGKAAKTTGGSNA